MKTEIKPGVFIKIPRQNRIKKIKMSEERFDELIELLTPLAKRLDKIIKTNG